MTETPRTSPSRARATTPASTVRPATPPPSRPGTITSSVIRPITMVNPTTAKANTLPARIPTAWGIGWARMDRRTSRAPRRATLGSATETASPGSTGSDPVDNGLGEFGTGDLFGVVHLPGEVVGDDPVGDRRLEGPGDVVGRVAPTDVFEHQHPGEDH